jgi:transposase InsO family protein
MLERMQFMAVVESGEFSFAECCRRFAVSRKTGYKLWARYQAEGAAGLSDRSRVAHHHPRALDELTVARIVNAKHAHPHWGPRKLRLVLAAADPDRSLPAISTVGDVLARHGLVQRRRGRRRVPPMSAPLGHCQGLNEIWSADFKGQFRLGNRHWCYPFTLSDNYSRYLLACHGLGHPTEDGVRRRCEAVFREFGLPQAIRTDNGAPFASSALAGLTRLSVWWVKLGIRPERIALGQPQQNGRHERMHRTLKAEATRPPASTLRAQQQRLDAFRREYNAQRPHEALGDRTPASVYTGSPRPFPHRLPAVEYGADTVVRRVRSNGAIKWRGDVFFLSEALIGEAVGLTPITDERWQIHFAHFPLAVLDDRLGQVIRLV